MTWLTMHGFVIAYISMCIDLTQLIIGGYKPSLLAQIQWITQLNSKCTGISCIRRVYGQKRLL